MLLGRIILEVEQLFGIIATTHVFEIPTANHKHRRRHTLAHVFTNHLVVGVGVIATQMRVKAAAIQRHGVIGVVVAGGPFNKGGQQVHGRNRLTDATRAKVKTLQTFWRGNDHRHPGRPLEVTHFVPEATFAQHVAMITGEHHNGVFIQTGVFQGLQQCANLVVNVAAIAVVSMAGIADFLVRNLAAVFLVHMQQAFGMRVLLVVVNLERRHINLVAGITVPVFLQAGVWIVRVRHRHRQTKRSLVGAAHIIIQIALGLKHDFIVEIELVGTYRYPSLGDR